MYECPATHPALEALFDPGLPNNPVLWAALYGRNGGRAWVDDLQAPSRCVLQTASILAFASRQVSQAFLHQVIARLRRLGMAWFVQSFPPSLAPQASSVAPRLEFYDCDADNAASAQVARKLGFQREMAYQVLEYSALP